MKIAFAPIGACKNNRRIWRYDVFTNNVYAQNRNDVAIEEHQFRNALSMEGTPRKHPTVSYNISVSGTKTLPSLSLLLASFEEARGHDRKIN